MSPHRRPPGGHRRGLSPVGRGKARRGAIASLLLSFAAMGVSAACGSRPEKPASRPVYWAHSPPVCNPDETREYYCDSLVPLRVGHAGPPPFDDCPVEFEDHESRFDRPPPVAVLDPSYTDYTRRRAAPGNACCFSWCTPLTLVEPNPDDIRQSCARPLVFKERFCIDEPESGSSQPAPAPFSKCPEAIVPPEKSIFAKPNAALLDDQGTQDRRSKGFAECCYAWCSVAPPSSGLEGSGPR